MSNDSKSNTEILNILKIILDNWSKLVVIPSFFGIMFIIYHSQKSNLSLMWAIFILLQVPYYIFKRNQIIKKHKDDFKI